MYEKATCTEVGEEERECSECYKTERKTVPATGVHVWTDWKTYGHLCTDGTYSRYCKECFKEETKIRKGNGQHNYAGWYTVTKANCLNNGKNVDNV